MCVSVCVCIHVRVCVYVCIFFILIFYFRMIEEQLDKFRKEASDMKVQNARLASQVI